MSDLATVAKEAPATGSTTGSTAGQRINSTDFLKAQRDNKLNTINLILALLLIGFGLGYVLGWGAVSYAAEDNSAMWSPQANLAGAVCGAVLLGIGIISSVVALVAGDKVVLALNEAKEVTADQEPMLHNVVEEMAIAAGVPKPRVAIIESPAMNAFATGMRTDKAAIGVTRGLLQHLNRDELQGVIAHEMGHIVNLDIRYMTAVGILVGLIALVCDAVTRANWRPSHSRSSGKGKGGDFIIILIVIVFVILAPIAAKLVQFAVSRQREYLADATSVQLTRNPLGLISALQKLEGQPRAKELGNRATQHLFIVNPIRDFSAKASALIATHPPIQDRIHRLQNLGRV